MKMPLPRFAAPLCALAFVLAGCATGPSSPSEPAKPTLLPAPANLPASKVATITIYRPEFGEPSDRHPTVSVNGSELVTPQTGTVFRARLLPGTYRFELDGEKAGDLKASAGKSYNFQLVMRVRGLSEAGRLGIVSPQQARDETAGLEPIDKDDIDNEAFR